MLTATINMKAASGEDIPLAQCLCNACDNNFWVAVCPENDPKYCAYCGTLFRVVEEVDENGDPKPPREILGE